MDLVRLQAMNAYWDEFPPLHLMVRAYLGIDRKPRRSTGPASAPDDETTSAILAQTPQGTNPQAMTTDTLKQMFADRAARLAEAETEPNG